MTHQSHSSRLTPIPPQPPGITSSRRHSSRRFFQSIRGIPLIGIQVVGGSRLGLAIVCISSYPCGTSQLLDPGAVSPHTPPVSCQWRLSLQPHPPVLNTTGPLLQMWPFGVKLLLLESHPPLGSSQFGVSTGKSHLSHPRVSFAHIVSEQPTQAYSGWCIWY